ncbi:MAG: ABC transporter transmembrane domain-containing protein, partial [Bacteroidota bacterium]
YLKPHKKLVSQLILGLLLGSIFQLIFPFLTQSLVDIGIDTKNLSFVHLVLIGQLMLFASQMMVRFIQSWILMHISIRINVNLVSDFLMKLMKLPLGFFDSKHIGDLLQRIDDHKRVEAFLTESSMSILLSLMNFIIFGVVLLVYSVPIFLLFLIFSVLYVGWVLIFLKKRKEIDQTSFYQLANNQHTLIEIIQGMPEIKLQGSQLKRRWKWADIQAKLFRIKVQSMALTQYQDGGALSLNQLKDIIITFVAAKAVLAGSMTLGMMLAIQYIIGQLNAPLQQLINFIRSAQDAKISLERLSEIHGTQNEEVEEVKKMAIIPPGDIVLENLSFGYSRITRNVLHNINLVIPRGKTTAIVGTSGSGKTTLIKLLLGFYLPGKGKIRIGEVPLDGIYKKRWRKECGVVMQEGYIFSDTIANNIAESDDSVDYSKLLTAATAANIMDYVHSLALGFSTLIGARGNGLSQGQKQRLLIARAVYKNPDFLFFDEATNALDANNEKIIMENLNQFLIGKTAVVVAHRLSTVKAADQIVVLEKGRIVEVGNHKDLVQKQGAYFTLVKNQLELGT